MRYLIFLFFIILSCGNEEEICNPSPNMGSTVLLDASYTSLRFSGTITPSECDNNIISQGIVMDTKTLPDINKIKKVQSGTSFEVLVDNLSPDTEYFIRTFLTNNEGDYYGPELKVTTLNPSVSFYDINVENSFETATFNSKYSFAEGSGVTVEEKGFYINNDKYLDTNLSSEGVIKIIKDGLNINTSYLYKAFVRTEYSEYLSEEKSFKTNDPSSTLKNFQIIKISFDEAEFSAEYDNEYTGSDITSEKGFIISENLNFENSIKLKSSSSGQIFNLIKTDLISDKIYYVKAYVENPYGVFTSDVESFSTLNAGYNFNNIEIKNTGYDNFNLLSTYSQINGETLSVSEKGFILSLNENMSNEIKFISSASSGQIEANTSGLDSNQKYYFQSYIINQFGTWKSSISNAFTLDASPSISSQTENIGLVKADAKLSFNFKENTTNSAINISLKNINTNEISNFELDLLLDQQTYSFINLKTNTNYAYTVTVTNQYTTYTSQEYSFKTLDDTPIITLEKELIGNNEVKITGIITASENAPTFNRIYLEFKHHEENTYSSVELNKDDFTINESFSNLVQGPEYTFRLVLINDYNTFNSEIYYNLPVTYKVGDKMFGGTIFYIDQTGYHGRVMVEPSYYSQIMTWSTDQVYVNSNDETNAGGACPTCNTDEDGSDNTQRIIDFYKGSEENSPAADYCNSLNVNGYNDWYLPTVFEINKAKQIVDLSSSHFWTCTELNEEQVWSHMKDGSTSNMDKWTNSVRTLPVRKF